MTVVYDSDNPESGIPELTEAGRELLEDINITNENMQSFKEELCSLINKYSIENGSGTPDFILAEYLIDCLHALNFCIYSREGWYTRDGQ